MKLLWLPVISGLTLAPVPCCAEPATNPTELHIEASGSVLADSAVYGTSYRIVEHGKEACDATLAESLTRTKARLLTAGLPAGAVTLTPTICEPADDADEPNNNFASYQPARKLGVRNGLVQTIETVPEANIAQSSEAANAAIAAANAAARKARIDAERARMSLPVFAAKVTVAVKVADLSKLPAIQRIFKFQYGQTVDHTDYVFNHPGDVQSAALASALTEARREGDLLASAVGCHIVRIARISNHAGSPSLTDIVNLFGQMKGNDLEWRIPATRSIAVAIDYVMVTN